MAAEDLLAPLIEASLDRYVRFLSELLRIPNDRMQEHASVRFVGEALAEAGCAADYFAGDGLGEPTPQGPPLNCVAHRRGRGGGRNLLLQAHMDTVPPGRWERWSDSPWSGTVRDGRVYGRGAHDDRVGAAIQWMVADLLRQMQVATDGDLHFLITTEEEYSCGGMKAYLRRSDRVRPDAHVLVDGNGRNRCITGHPGVLSFTIRIEGAWCSAQSRTLAHAANPIEWMAHLLPHLRGWEERVRELLAARSVDPRWPPATIVATEIGSRGWISNVPEECFVRGFCNVPPPLTLEEYQHLFHDHLQAAAAGSPWLAEHPPVIEWGPLEVRAMITDEGSEFHRLLARSHEESFGSPLAASWIGGWGDMVLLDCPNAIFYGPGGGGGDHSYDEYFELRDLAPMLAALVKVVLTWCGRAEGRRKG